MANNQYTYPRVTLSHTAKVRSAVGPGVEDTTILFMPFIAEKGPIAAEEDLKTIHSLGEFITKFGELDFEKNGQTALVIYNWLTSGGTLLPYRLNNYGKEGNKTEYKWVNKNNEESYKVLFKSKYIGSEYDKLDVRIIYLTSNSVRVSVYENGREVETYKITENNFKSMLSMSSRIVLESGIEFLNLSSVVSENNKVYTLAVNNSTGLLEETDLYNLLRSFWEKDALETIVNELAVKIDMIMDAGYPADIKEKMVKFISNDKSNPGSRTDIVGLFDTYSFTSTGCYEKPTASSYDDNASGIQHTNVAMWTQYFLVHDAIFSGRDIFVTPTYFLSKLIPANDNQYGVQFPTAGLRRGVLEDAKAVYSVLKPADKEEYFKRRINYCEKSPREYAFMSQRTYDGSTEDEYTALSFLNNVRALEKMKKELKATGRRYLFEYADGITISNMDAALDKYMSQWVANRTLSDKKVVCEIDEYNSEKVNVSLQIRFNNTIEVISVDIEIE